MSSSLGNKLDYTIDTKALFRQALESKGQAVTDENTFRDYVDMIANITDLYTQDKTIDPSTIQQVIQADSPYNALGSVTINEVTNDIDENIVAENIKLGTSILGVEGTYDGGISEALQGEY